MNRTRLNVLFQHYVNGTCTEEERNEFLLYVAESEHDKETKMLLDELWQQLPEHTVAVAGSEHIVERILSKTQPAGLTKKRFTPTLAIAACISTILLAIAGYYWVVPTSLAVPVSQTTQTTEGFRFIKLPDGSTVLLHEDSKLTYATGFTANSREVSLSGEAYFDIKHDPARPFIVHTGAIKTTVLGTAFQIKAYPRDKNVTVTVTRGKVSVGNHEKIFRVVTPDHQLIINTEEDEIDHQPVNSRNALAWTDRDIFFDDVTLEDAARLLSERFQVTIQFQNSKLKLCSFTATFPKGEDLDQILTVISEFNNASYRKTANGTIEFTGEGCTP
jgi:transmembrane sensor